jgi:hypothetical protein
MGNVNAPCCYVYTYIARLAAAVALLVCVCNIQGRKSLFKIVAVKLSCILLY